MRSRRPRTQTRIERRRRAAQRGARQRMVLLTSLLVALAVLLGIGGIKALGDPRVYDSRAVAGTGGGATVPSDPVRPPEPGSSMTPPASPSPVPPRVVESGPGTYGQASGTSAVLGRAGELLRYRVAVEDTIAVPTAEFARFVDAVLADPRSWIADGRWRFQRVSSGPVDFTVFLATPASLTRLCPGLGTNTNCRYEDNVVINLSRWLMAAAPFAGYPLEIYRQYAINHEVGHRLGFGHEKCPRPGAMAPVMLQQTLQLDGCTPNAWPYIDGQRYAGPPVAP